MQMVDVNPESMPKPPRRIILLLILSAAAAACAAVIQYPRPERVSEAPVIVSPTPIPSPTPSPTPEPTPSPTPETIPTSGPLIGLSATAQRAFIDSEISKAKYCVSASDCQKIDGGNYMKGTCLPFVNGKELQRINNLTASYTGGPIWRDCNQRQQPVCSDVIGCSYLNWSPGSTMQ